MRQPCIVLVLMVAMVAMVTNAADTAATPPAPKPLELADRLQIRDAQLALAQAHIARLQAEASVTSAEGRIVQLIQTLKKQYACPDCTLNENFTWTPAPEATPPATPAEVVTPASKDGANSEKE